MVCLVMVEIEEREVEKTDFMIFFFFLREVKDGKLVGFRCFLP